MADDLREKLAEYAHKAWSGWMEYLFSKGTLNEDGTWTMPKWAVDRWRRQSTQEYSQLPEKEKLSDRMEADEILRIVNAEYYLNFQIYRANQSTLTLEEVREEISLLANTMSTYKALADKIGISPQYLNDILHNHRKPGPQVLDFLHLQQVVFYIEKEKEKKHAR